MRLPFCFQSAKLIDLPMHAALSLDVGPARRQGVLGSAGSELVLFDLDLTQVGKQKYTHMHITKARMLIPSTPLLRDRDSTG